MTTDNLAACRAEFEAWAKGHWLGISLEPSEDGSHDGYYSEKTFYAWIAWQAAYSARPAPAITGETVKIACEAYEQDCKAGVSTLGMLAALTAALPHAVDAASVYNQAVEDCANILWIGEKPPLEVPEYNGNRDDYERDVLNWSDYCHAQQIRALKNPTATAGKEKQNG